MKSNTNLNAMKNGPKPQCYSKHSQNYLISKSIISTERDCTAKVIIFGMEQRILFLKQPCTTRAQTKQDNIIGQCF